MSKTKKKKNPVTWVGLDELRAMYPEKGKEGRGYDFGENTLGERSKPK